jgi:hypothetical protein
VAAALAEKYGAGNVMTETIQNRMGAIFENKIYTWRRKDSELEARHYSYNLDTSSVNYMSDSFVQGFGRRKGKTGKEKAKDL